MTDSTYVDWVRFWQRRWFVRWLQKPFARSDPSGSRVRFETAADCAKRYQAVEDDAPVDDAFDTLIKVGG